MCFTMVDVVVDILCFIIFIWSLSSSWLVKSDLRIHFKFKERTDFWFLQSICIVSSNIIFIYTWMSQIMSKKWSHKISKVFRKNLIFLLVTLIWYYRNLFVAKYNGRMNLNEDLRSETKNIFSYARNCVIYHKLLPLKIFKFCK